MKLDEIKAVMQLMKENDIAEFEFEGDEQRYKLKRQQTIVDGENRKLETSELTNSKKSEENQPITINAPMVGIFYQAPSPDEKPFVKVGDQVEKGQTIAVIEAMKMMHDVTADRAGTITEILAGNEENVEYGQPLFEIKID